MNSILIGCKEKKKNYLYLGGLGYGLRGAGRQCIFFIIVILCSSFYL